MGALVDGPIAQTQISGVPNVPRHLQLRLPSASAFLSRR